MLLLNFKVFFIVSSIKSWKYRKNVLKTWHSGNLMSFQNCKNINSKTRMWEREEKSRLTAFGWNMVWTVTLCSIVIVLFEFSSYYALWPSTYQTDMMKKHDSRPLCRWDRPPTCVFQRDGEANESTQWFLPAHRLVCVSFIYKSDICRNCFSSSQFIKMNPNLSLKHSTLTPNLSCQVVLEISVPF